MSSSIGTSPSASFADPFVGLGRDAARLGVTLDSGQLAVCRRYADELVQRNTSVNLTAITEPADIARKHFLDSFTALAARRWTGRERVVDVGSGAGFPGLALRIALRDLRVCCVESVGKKARFLEEIVATLELSEAVIRQARAEELSREREHRAGYDVATARAVGTLAACAEYLLPFLRVGGEAIVWKGKFEAELPAAERALVAMGGEIASVVSTESLGVGEALPGRHLVVLRKTRPTSERYPRRAMEARRHPW